MHPHQQAVEHAALHLANAGKHAANDFISDPLCPRTQDGRPLRRNKRRWKIERLFPWLGNFRRLVVRYERYALTYLSFVQLGGILILLR